MRLKAFPSIVDCSHHASQGFAPTVPSSSLFTSSSRYRPVSVIVLSDPFVSKTLLRSQSFNKFSRGHTIRRSCSSNLDDFYHDEPSFQVEGLANSSGEVDSEDDGRHRKKNVHCTTSKKSPFSDKHGGDQDSFLHSRFDFLEPMMLGIRPEFPDWPDQETVVWATIEQKAKSCDIPLSLRMIKKKLQRAEGFTESKESPAYCSVKTAFASMVFIVVELQSYALHMREALCHEDLEIISSKVQKEMHSSFVWLFQQVFSRTPALMLHVMILLANFSVHSASRDITIAETSPLRASTDMFSVEEKQVQYYPSSLSSLISETGVGSIGEKTQIGQLPLESEAEMMLWNSMVDDAAKMREGIDDEVLDHETMQYFVSPVSVKLEPDVSYEDYLRTDLLYQMNLSQDPNNPLLLCNYAQFLHLVAHDYDRAEECFKRAVQVLPPDAEPLCLYANFLWTVRRDYWGAEDRFLQSLSVEPNSSYYASRYANFLWNTGGEETCFPLNNPNMSEKE
ncbi:hypothetical protein Salat_0817000 [Sesamum alatum]|uniref:Tetratricopeptide repeat-like superfamily protein n=1 Tax=Sesamum alatum TaxID=300844 RepID=A0AAE2CW13_9LAMI|nr:hypothetical protein Salat_0817000 [Sesamum alatum]